MVNYWNNGHRLVFTLSLSFASVATFIFISVAAATAAAIYLLLECEVLIHTFGYLTLLYFFVLSVHLLTICMCFSWCYVGENRTDFNQFSIRSGFEVRKYMEETLC